MSSQTHDPDVRTVLGLLVPLAGFGLIEYRDINEPVKYMTGENPIKCIFVICKKD